MPNEKQNIFQKVINAYAVDFDDAPNWQATIGRCLFQSHLTGKPPAILLTMETPGDEKHLEDLNATIAKFKLPIKVCPLRESERGM